MWSFSPEEILFWPPSITKKSTNPKSKRVKKNGFISILKTSILRFTCKAAGNKHLLDKKKLIKNAIIGRRERKLREKKRKNNSHTETRYINRKNKRKTAFSFYA